MRIFHKQLILLFLLLGVVFGTSSYYYFTSLDRVVEELARESTRLVADKFKAISEARLKRVRGVKWTEKDKKALREALLSDVSPYEQIVDFFLVRADSQVVFTLNKQSFKPRHPFNLFFTSDNNHAEIHLLNDDGSGYYEAYWRPGNKKNLTAILAVNATYAVQDIRHEFTKKVYLTGFAGVLAVILIALASARVIDAPFKKIERAMVSIDKRRYGFRLKGRRDHEFKDVFEKVNLALQRLEQLDSVQRTAVQRKNNLISELKATARSMDTLAHEVKNPLQAMVFSIDGLKTKIERGRARSEMLKHTRIIEREIDHLKEIIEGFLHYVRPGVPQKERLQINDLIKEVCQMVAAKAARTKIKIETRLAKALNDVMLDREQFKQALHNLIINAIHASSDGSKIIVRTWAKRDKILIAVIDEGSGIPREELKKIFELYYTTKKEGSGIGLPVTKRIIEANGGQMQLESEVGKGTTVTVIVKSL